MADMKNNSSLIHVKYRTGAILFLTLVFALLALATPSTAENELFKRLDAALEKGGAKAIIRLVGKDAKKEDAVDKNDALIWAASKGHLEIARLLIQKGADVTTKDKYGYTPLELAIRKDNIEIVKLLMEKGADVNVRDSLGNTPLHLAVSRGKPDVVRLLIEKGADVNAKDGNGITPLECTRLGGCSMGNATNVTEIARILKEYNGHDYRGEEKEREKIREEREYRQRQAEREYDRQQRAAIVDGIGNLANTIAQGQARSYSATAENSTVSRSSSGCTSCASTRCTSQQNTKLRKYVILRKL